MILMITIQMQEPIEKILCGAPNTLKSRFNIDFKLILAILASGNSNIQRVHQ